MFRNVTKAHQKGIRTAAQKQVFSVYCCNIGNDMGAFSLKKLHYLLIVQPSIICLPGRFNETILINVFVSL